MLSEKKLSIEQLICEVKPVAEHLDGVEKELIHRADQPHLSITSLPDLNSKLWGLKSGLTIIGARTSIGKTAFALQIASDLAKQNKRVLFLSLEMTIESMVERLFCNMESVDNFDLLTGKMRSDVGIAKKWLKFKDDLEDAPLVFTCGIGLDCSEVGQVVENMEEKPDVIFIDYIQAVRYSRNEREVLNEYIRHFRGLCIQNGIAGVMCSQANRQTFNEDNKEPALANLKSCIIGSTLVSGERIKDIVDKKINMKIKTLNLKTGKTEYKNPARFVNSGLMNCYEIRTKSGKKIILSDTTKMYSGRAWKTVDKLSVGDKIVIEEHSDQLKGRNMNTGRTHFKKGCKAWNKGMRMPYTKARGEYDKRQKGVPKPKPKNFSEIMRKVNPPFGKKNRMGYKLIYLPDYPNSRKVPPDYGYIFEHRYLLEKHLGITIKFPQQVHHLNGDKADNRLENLILCNDTSNHCRIHHEMEILVFDMIKKGEVIYDKEKKVFVRRNS